LFVSPDVDASTLEGGVDLPIEPAGDDLVTKGQLRQPRQLFVPHLEE
jgi:hypothetical protein